MSARLASAPKTPPTAVEIGKACGSLRLRCDEALAEKLTAYLGELEKWNRRINLVSPDAWPDMLALCADSWHLADFLGSLSQLPESPRCLDMGAGSGLPGIPLRMLWQPGEYHLVEIRGKRAIFLRTVLARLDLPGTSVFEGKAEDALERYAPVDLVLSRAFMPWPKFLDLVAPGLAPHGLALIMSSDPPPDTPHAPESGIWRLTASLGYQAPVEGGKPRWLWALARS